MHHHLWLFVRGICEIMICVESVGVCGIKRNMYNNVTTAEARCTCLLQGELLAETFEGLPTQVNRGRIDRCG